MKDARSLIEVSSMSIFSLRIGIAAAVLSACSPATPGAKPTDMSANDHARAAAEHDRTADVTPTGTETCSSGRVVDASLSGACWTRAADQAEAHRRMAADHRAASAALRDSEAKACAGVGPNDRDESPFGHPDDLVGVEPLVSTTSSSKGSTAHTDGATITIRAVPGLTAEYLQRVVSCHLARNASMGFAMDEMSFCPLAVKGASAIVSSGSGSFRVDIRGDGDAATKEILRRANALGSHAH